MFVIDAAAHAGRHASLLLVAPRRRLAMNKKMTARRPSIGRKSATLRALGGNRPVGPACNLHYRAGGAPTQYDGVLAERPRGVAPSGFRSGKPLKNLNEVARGQNARNCLGHMA